MMRFGWLVPLLSLLACGGDPPELREKLVVIGVDSADWTWIDERIEVGGMPHLSGLIQRGVRADLRSLMPPQKSPTIWTSIATGKRPARHGIADFITHERHVTGSAQRQAASYWEILGALGRRVAVVGWWVSYPATPVNGILVSDYLQYSSGFQDDRPEAVYPPEEWQRIAALRITGDDVDEALLGRFIDLEIARAHPEESEALLADLKWMIAADESYRRIARALYEREAFDVFTVYFRGLDMVSHRYWEYFKPGQAGVQPKEWAAEMLADLIPNYHEYADELIGEVLGYTDPKSRVVLCSDHGFHGHRRTRDGLALGVGMHEDDGILVMAGPGILEAERWTNAEGRVRAEVKDIAPTLLAMCGIPPAHDMDGKVLGEAFEPRFRRFTESLLPDAVASYDALQSQADSVATDGELDAEVIERLRSLGYID